MGRSPCCSKEGLNRGAWTAIEDKILVDYIKVHGEGKWRSLPKRAGLKRCGKSCRLRWMNYLRPDIKRGNITHDEEDLIIRLHKLLGNRWSLIAGRLPGRTDNEIKNYWNTNIGKKLQGHPISTSNRRSSSSIQPKQSQSPPIGRLSRGPQAEYSGVVRTKASRCTRVFISQELAETAGRQLEANSVNCGGPVEAASRPLIMSCAQDNCQTSDFMMDIEMDDKFLSDFLSTDFGPVLGDSSDVLHHHSSLQSVEPLLDDHWLQEK